MKKGPNSTLQQKIKIDSDTVNKTLNKIKTIIFYVLIFISTNSIIIKTQTYEGYTLYSPNNSRYTYLIDINKTVVHSWSHTKTGGYSCYLLEDGSLMRSATSSNSQLNGGGATGIIQKVAWDGSLLWEYTYSSSTYRAHHDFEPMPNGNVLIIAWEVKTAAQAVLAGLKRSITIWPDHIIEVQPAGTTGGTIVWQWHAWDHLIQNYDATKNNYGVISEHPELLNINVGSTSSGDWMHVNGISYNAELDQIVFSSHNLDEVYVIDHSTTTAEAASHSGGTYGKGGDFLYRWGCPSNYGVSGSQVFSVVHCATWIPAGYPGAGNIMAFNNRENQSTSMVVEIVPPRDGSGNYTYTSGTAFGPVSPLWSYTASGFYSQHLGGCQRLPNGNTFIVEATTGVFWEVNSAGTVVWNYTKGGEIARALRYSASYPGLSVISDTQETETITPASFSISQNYPNPFNPNTTIDFVLPAESFVNISVYNSLGQLISTLINNQLMAGTKSIIFDAALISGGLSSGVYFYRINAKSLTDGKEFSQTKKMILLQ
ncbi:MAG: aryl-sulfate sulfotransferase [bacterium]